MATKGLAKGTAGLKGVGTLARRRRRRRSGTHGLNDSFITKLTKDTESRGHLMLQGALGVATYIAIPTFLNLDGPMVAVVGGLSTFVLGALLGYPGTIAAAAIMPLGHLAYGYLQEPAKPLFGRYFSKLNPNAPIAGTNTIPATSTPEMQGLAGPMSYYPQPDGSMSDVFVAPHPGLPQLGPGPGTGVNGLSSYDATMFVQPDYFGGRAR